MLAQENETDETQESVKSNLCTMAEQINEHLAKYKRNRNYKVSSGAAATENELNESAWLLEKFNEQQQAPANILLSRMPDEAWVEQVEPAFCAYISWLEQLNMELTNNALSRSGNFERYKYCTGEEIHFMAFHLFAQVFIRLFQLGRIEQACKFFDTYENRFEIRPTQRIILDAMRESCKLQRLDDKLTIYKHFKTRIIISEELKSLFEEFLEGNPSLMQNAIEVIQPLLLDSLGFSSKEVSTSALPEDRCKKDLLIDMWSTSDNDASHQSIAPIVNMIEEMRHDQPDGITNAGEVRVCMMHIDSPEVCSVLFSRDSSQIVLGMENSVIHLYDFHLADQLQYYSHRAARHWQRVPVWHDPSNVHLPQYDSYVAKQDQCKGRNLSEKVEPIVLRGHTDAVYELAYFPVDHDSQLQGIDKHLLISCSGDRTVRLWDSQGSGSCLQTYRGHLHPIWTLDVLAQDSLFATGCSDGHVYLWDIQRSSPLRMLINHEDDVNQVRFNGSSHYLASASDDTRIIIWDMQQKLQVRQLCGHRKPVKQIHFSQCGKYLLSISLDDTARVWDIRAGGCLKTEATSLWFAEQNQPVQCITTSYDDRLIAAADCSKPSNLMLTSNRFFPVPSSELPDSSLVTSKHKSPFNIFHLQFVHERLLFAVSKRAD